MHFCSISKLACAQDSGDKHTIFSTFNRQSIVQICLCMFCYLTVRWQYLLSFLKVVAMVAPILSRRLYTQIIVVHTLGGMWVEMCHLEVMMTLAMRMYGDLVPFLFMIPLYHFLLLFFYYSSYLCGAGESFCGQTKVFFKVWILIMTTYTPYLGCRSEYCLFIYVLSLGAVKRRWRRIKSGGAPCTTSVADICRVKVHFLWVLFSVFIPPFTCGTVVFVYLNLKVSIELYDILIL